MIAESLKKVTSAVLKKFKGAFVKEEREQEKIRQEREMLRKLQLASTGDPQLLEGDYISFNCLPRHIIR